MPTIDETRLSGKTRDMPINDRLRAVLLAAAERSGIDTVIVVSGGQPGSKGGRVGSTRHDGGNAADLMLRRDGRILNFTRAGDRAVIEEFVAAAAANGALGIGAGVDYMGPETLHVGFGLNAQDRTRVVWGAKGSSARAPAWLRQAAQRGWDDPEAFRGGAGHAAGLRPWDRDLDGVEEIDGGELDMPERFERLAPQVMGWLIRDFDLTPEQAAGVVGNLGAESNLAAVQERGQPWGEGGFGWAQWTGNRRRTFFDWCSRNALDPRSDEANYGYLKAELSGQIPGENYRRTVSRLRATTTVEEAVDVFEATYEKAGRNTKRMEARYRCARQAYALYMRAPPQPDLPDWSPGRDDIPARPPGFPPEVWNLVRQVLEARRTITSAGAKSIEFGQKGDEVLLLQRRLAELRYHTGGIDGAFGVLTRRAVAAFQVDNGLPGTGVADPETLALLNSSSPARFASGRESATADMLRALGSREIINADRIRYAGLATAGVGALGAGQSAFGGGSIDAALREFVTRKDQFSKVFGQDFAPFVDKAQAYLNAKPQATGLGAITDLIVPIIGSIVPGGFAGSLLTLALGLGGSYFANNIVNRRVALHRDGRHIGAVGDRTSFEQ